MSDNTTAAPASPPVLPKLIISRPAEDCDTSTSAKPTLASRRRSKTEGAASKEGGRLAAIEWIETNQTPRKRRRASHRSASSSGSELSANSRSRRHTESGADRFFPKLSRILETNESRNNSRPGTSGSDVRRQPEKAAARKTRRKKEDHSVGYRRAVRNRAGGVSRRAEPLFKVNPSLLSVLSSLSRSTERSSSSSTTTITQLSYDRRVPRNSGSETIRKDRLHFSASETEANEGSSSALNVFDYMEATPLDDDRDGRTTHSTMSSSSSSHYEPSDAGSSDFSGTPSSQSTFPSPTVTRNSSFSSNVAELRRKYDMPHASSTPAELPSSPTSQIPARYVKRYGRRDASVEDGARADGNAGTRRSSDCNRDERPSPRRRESRPVERTDDQLRYQEDAMRRHLAQAQPAPQYNDSIRGEHRSSSRSSQSSTGSTRNSVQFAAVQQYQYPSPPVPMAYPVPPPPAPGHMPYPGWPPAPDAPDLNQKTFVGYEQLALELSRNDTVKPLYRKFEYLNHRILLHIQDELCEMEEQLRTMDEIIAQMEQVPPEGSPPPASRRSEAFNGTDMHHRRTALLGRIFLKTEQYNRAMSSFAAINKDSQPAESTQVAAYREWLQKKAPIHEAETRFLQAEDDLIIPAKPKTTDTTYYDCSDRDRRSRSGSHDSGYTSSTPSRMGSLRRSVRIPDGGDRRMPPPEVKLQRRNTVAEPKRDKRGSSEKRNSYHAEPDRISRYRYYDNDDGERTPTQGPRRDRK